MLTGTCSAVEIFCFLSNERERERERERMRDCVHFLCINSFSNTHVFIVH